MLENLTRRKIILSRHPSHIIFRKKMPILKGISYIVRLGSTTVVNKKPARGNKFIEINSIEGIKKSSNKLLMKVAFTKAKVKTADWWTTGALNDWARDKYPIVAKHKFGSRGTGNTLIHSILELENWMNGKNLKNYIFEKFYNYVREYRLHVSKFGCFYTCRKMLKEGTPEKEKWHRHDSNSVWILESNPSFDKPICWNNIVKDCQNALITLNLDFAAFDVKVQSAKDSKGNIKKEVDYIIIESNSAPSFGEVTTEMYLNEIQKLIKNK
jgi:glutathione synthase/RimK-type ligase-like ATP-grasp enzyme